MNRSNMKIIVFALSLFLVASLVVLRDTAIAQELPPPPAPLIYSAPLTSDIKEFVSKQAHFSVNFPGGPNTTVAKNDKFVLTSFRVKVKGSNSVVNFIEYEASIESKMESMIENYRRGILDNPFVVDNSAFPRK